VSLADHPLGSDMTYDSLRAQGIYLFCLPHPSSADQVVPVLSLFQVVRWCEACINNTVRWSEAERHAAYVLLEITRLREKYDWFDFERFHMGASSVWAGHYRLLWSFWSRRSVYVVHISMRFVRTCVDTSLSMTVLA
jgi:hypothetical protein